MTNNPDETLPVEQCDRKPLTLTCRCGAANERSLPYGLNPVDWCRECGMLFGDGDKPPRYMPGFPLSGVPAQSPPPVVSEAMWGGLARDLMMWLDMDPKTPRALFEHLRRIGREIPQWLRDEPEMKALDHVPSKGTRCVLIWRAMNEAALSSPSRGCDLETVEAADDVAALHAYYVRQAAYEECAKVADRMQEVAAERLQDDHDDDAAAQHDTAMEIAAAIRNLGKETRQGEPPPLPGHDRLRGGR